MKTYDVQNDFQGGFTERRTNTKFIVVHHAAALYPQLTGLGDVRAVARYHLSKGWSGIGYHICLADDVDEIARYNVSDPDLIRAHVANRNAECVGVSCLTNFTDIPERKWIDALVPTLAELCVRYPEAKIVGHADIALPGYSTSCPGPRWKEWKGALIREVQGRLKAAPKETITADSSILSEPRGTQAQVVKYIMGRAHGEYTRADIEKKITPGYFAICQVARIDPILAVAQMIHETGNLSSFWAARPQRNPAGIGVTGAPGQGLRFPGWISHAIPAHVGRLLAYASRDRNLNDAQLSLIKLALGARSMPASFRGVAPTLHGLNGRWAVPGTGYADQIAAVANSLIQ